MHNLFVVGPSVGIERGVSDVPYGRAAQLVGSGAGDDLNLPVAASQFRVHGREDDAELAHHIGIDESGGSHTIGVSPFLHAQAVSYRVDGGGADAGERCGRGIDTAADPGHGLHQIEHIVAHQREITDLIFRQHLTNGWRRFSNQSRSLRRDFNGIRRRTDVQRKVVTAGGVRSELYIVVDARFEAWQFCGQLIGAGQKARNVVRARFVCDR